MSKLLIRMVLYTTLSSFISINSAVAYTKTSTFWTGTLPLPLETVENDFTNCSGSSPLYTTSDRSAESFGVIDFSRIYTIKPLPMPLGVDDFDLLIKVTYDSSTKQPGAIHGGILFKNILKDNRPEYTINPDPFDYPYNYEFLCKVNNDTPDSGGYSGTYLDLGSSCADDSNSTEAGESESIRGFNIMQTDDLFTASWNFGDGIFNITNGNITSSGRVSGNYRDRWSVPGGEYGTAAGTFSGFFNASTQILTFTMNGGTTDYDSDGEVSDRCSGSARFTLTQDKPSIYDPATSSLHLPKVIIHGDSSGKAYSIDMIDQGEFNFSVMSVTEISVLTQEKASVYNPVDGGLNLPKVTVHGDSSQKVYNVDMIYQGGFNFSVTEVVNQ